MATPYWDLEEKERAQLTEAEVEKYCDFELMTAGVLKVKPLVLATVPPMPEPDLELHVPMSDSYHSIDIGSDDAAACGDVINSCVRISAEWVGGKHVDVARPFAKDAEVRIKRVYSAERFAEARALIERANSAKAANEKADAEYAEACKKQREALKGLWEDWHECLAKHARLGQIINTWHEYVATAGSEELAAKFLAKAFEHDDIVEAAEWWSVAIPLFAPEVEPEPVHTPAPERGAAELDLF